MPGQQRWKEWKTKNPVTSGNFEKLVWYDGEEDEDGKVAVQARSPSPSERLVPQYGVVKCRGCSDWELKDLISEAIVTPPHISPK